MKEQEAVNKKPDHFIQKIIKKDIASGKISKNGLVTRFPPEPNGYLHIGHAKAICLNFGLAEEFGGRCHLRFDDTNPETSKVEYIQSIQEDIKWLGFDWGEHIYYASDYFEQLYKWAIALIQKKLAFVDDSSVTDIQKMRGSLKKPGENSPFRNRSVEENLELFEKMKEGKFEEGSKVLRAKINMSSGNMNFRDPILYRILKKTPHPRTGHTWNVYPTYDFAHGQSDAIEKITHSLCTLEFKDHNPLYDWFLEKLEISHPPKQYEFARLNLDHTILSKRHLLDLVETKNVHGWDDPRMPTLRGMRHRGYPAASIKELCHLIGVTTANSTIGLYNLEDLVRKQLDQEAHRLMTVVDPVKVIITNYPKTSEILKAKKHPKKDLGQRDIPFSREVLIERSDFEKKINKEGAHVRLRYAYIIRCDKVVRDHNNQVVELECSYYSETRGGKPPSEDRGLKKSQKPQIIHWVCVKSSHLIEVHHYDHLFWWWEGNEKLLDGDLKKFFNQKSLIKITKARIEHSFTELSANKSRQIKPVQFERLGYYVIDPNQKSLKPVFNRVIALRDLFMQPHVFYEFLCKQKDAMNELFNQWVKLEDFYQEIQESLNVNKVDLCHKMLILVTGLINIIEKQIKRFNDDPSRINQGFSLFNKYIITPHSSFFTETNKEQQSQASDDPLLERFRRLDIMFSYYNVSTINYRVRLLWSLFLIFGDPKEQSKISNITYFLKESENKFYIPIEKTTALMTQFTESQWLDPLDKMKNILTTDKSKQKKIDQKDVKHLRIFLEDIMCILVQYSEIILIMSEIHTGKRESINIKGYSGIDDMIDQMTSLGYEFNTRSSMKPFTRMDRLHHQLYEKFCRWLFEKNS